MIEYIREKLTTEELLVQLAENAGELGHAALRLRRVYDGSNPTRTSYEAAIEKLHEKIADVKLLLKILGMDDPNKRAKHNHIMEATAHRWALCLKKNARTQNANHDRARVVQLEAELAAALAYISANKDCTTCKHQPSDGNPECRTAEWNCADCSKTECKCWSCGPNANKWEWRGTCGNE